MTITSVFDSMDLSVYDRRYLVSLHVSALAGGTPTDPKVAESWLKTKLGIDRDDLIRDEVAKTMIERGVDSDMDSVVEEVVANKHLNGFKRDEAGLYIEGRQVKAAIKEAANIRWSKDRWGPSKKGTKSFFAEHVFVAEDRIYLRREGVPLTEADRVAQRFVHTFRGNGIQYEEICEGVNLDFVVVTDHDFKPDQWAELWVTGQRQGVGASRSQGYGTYLVTTWSPLSA